MSRASKTTDLDTEREETSLKSDEGVSPAARLASVAKATGKVFRRDSNYKDTGDSDPCPTVDEAGRPLGHGRMYRMSSGADWCPHQSHDMGVPRSGVYHRPEAEKEQIDG